MWRRPILLSALAVAGCTGLNSEVANDAEDRLTGSRLAGGELITKADCGELSDGDIECEVDTARGTTTCTANGRDGTVRGLTCGEPR